MIKFLDGPATGVVLPLHRAPTCLRVVRAADGKWDALDQLDDRAEPGETIYVYRSVGHAGMMHMSCRPRKNSGWYAIAEYRHVPEAPALADNEAWRKWTLENRAMMEADVPAEQRR